MISIAKTLCALAVLASTAAAPAPKQLGIGVHILPGYASITVDDKITVVNDEDFDVDVECVSQDTGGMVFSGTVYGGSQDSWTLTDDLSGDTLDVSVYLSGTSVLVNSQTYSVQ